MIATILEPGDITVKRPQPANQTGCSPQGKGEEVPRRTKPLPNTQSHYKYIML